MAVGKCLGVDLGTASLHAVQRCGTRPFVQAAVVAVGEETDRGERVMVEVTFRPVVACHIKGGGDAAQRASDAGPALACRAGEPVGQAQPEEREGGRRS
jgi:hypothetical protein